MSSRSEFMPYHSARVADARRMRPARKMKRPRLPGGQVDMVIVGMPDWTVRRESAAYVVLDGVFRVARKATS